MDTAASIARFNWPQAKVVHYHPGDENLPAAWSTDDPSTTEPASISIVLAGDYEAVVEGGGRRHTRRVAPGRVTLCGPEPIRWLRGSGSAEFIEITASEAFRRGLAEELGVPEHAGLGDIHGWSDPIVGALAARFRSAVRGARSLPDLERDALLRRLYGRVLELRFAGRSRGRGDGGLDGVRLARVLEFIDAHLEDEVTIAGLADVAALSPFHFIRAFRRSSGLTPQRYVRGRRLEHARGLIASGLGPQAAAERIGYENIGSFRSAYRSHFGRSYGDARKRPERPLRRAAMEAN